MSETNAPNSVATTMIDQAGTGTSDGVFLGESGGKIGFLGTTPTAQRANASQAAATDAATVIVLANEIRAALVAFGLIKGSA
jgi:hypothetical protein